MKTRRYLQCGQRKTRLNTNAAGAKFVVTVQEFSSLVTGWVMGNGILRDIFAMSNL